ncbi:MAG: hypothetical protein QGH90_01345 [Candidatus Poseidoniaceae archaeon]|jgi:hypothetical protein|nr:hypothetical protein [Candidatus Poseidoniaceae archaeon]MDP7000525.1 hypothetical protein [Candidatus Poseidoniaceae archaeon]
MRTAILVIGFKRLSYFQQTLESLERNPESQTLDFYFYLDGGRESRQDELIEMINTSSIKNKHIVCRESNYGIGRHLIGARREIFDGLGYDRLILFEDDMILSSSYISTVLKISDWAHQYDNVGTVMAYNLNTTNREEQLSDLDKVIPTNRHFWGYCLTRKVWDDIKHVLYDYEEEYLDGVPYKKRNHRRIRKKYMPHWMTQPRRKYSGKLLEIPEDALTPPFAIKQDRNTPTSQDAMTALGLWNAGYARLTTVVPRARYIGIHGLSFSPRVFRKQGFDTQQYFEFEEDGQLGEFELMLRDDTGKLIKPKKYE